MATKKKPAQAQDKQADGGDILQKTAKAIGAALGTIAGKTGIAQPGATPKKSGKLVKKMKQRLPRKLKKAQKKRALS
jgi:hypothetical protein